MQKYFFEKLIFVTVFLVFTGCNKISAEQERESLLREYTERYMQANSPFADDATILSTIAYMDSINEKERNRNITSIYYNKAGLLFKLKRYDEALDELYKTDDDFYDIHKATLLFRLGRDSEADLFLDKAIAWQKRGLKESLLLGDKENITGEAKNSIQGLMMLYIWNNYSRETLINEIAYDNILSSSEAEILLDELFINMNSKETKEVKEIMINSMWQDRD